MILSTLANNCAEAQFISAIDTVPHAADAWPETPKMVPAATADAISNFFIVTPPKDFCIFISTRYGTLSHASQSVHNATFVRLIIVFFHSNVVCPKQTIIF
jgi:hypothetical protein